MTLFIIRLVHVRTSWRTVFAEPSPASLAHNGQPDCRNRDCRRTPARACARRYCQAKARPALFTHRPRHPPWAWSWPTTPLGMPHRIDGNTCGSAQARRRCMPSPPFTCHPAIPIQHWRDMIPRRTVHELHLTLGHGHDAPRSISPCWPCGEGVAQDTVP